jgi:hypothetical protein
MGSGYNVAVLRGLEVTEQDDTPESIMKSEWELIARRAQDLSAKSLDQLSRLQAVAARYGPSFGYENVHYDGMTSTHCVGCKKVKHHGSKVAHADGCPVGRYESEGQK